MGQAGDGFERHRSPHQQKHHGRGHASAVQHIGQVRPLQRAHDKEADQGGIAHRDGGGLGWSENAAQNAAQDDYRRHQRPDRLKAGLPALAPCGAAGGGGQVVVIGHEMDQQHQPAADHNARHDAGQKQRRHAFAHHIGIDDHDPRRRDDRADDRTCRRHCCGKAAGVALLFHRRDQH